VPDEVIADKIACGLLPRDTPLKAFIGKGSGGDCDGCGKPITRHQIEHEMDFPGDRTVYMHAGCAEIWGQATGNL
jgi:hypothetical protein